MKKKESVSDMAIHSVIIGAGVFVYMVLFGHGLPTALRGPVGKRLGKPL